MPKKFAGENSKASAARERKAEVQRVENERKQKANDDAFWADDDKHVQKKLQRKEEEERKKLDMLKRKEENRQAYEDDMTKAGVRTENATKAPQKVTRAQLAARAEAMMRQVEEQKRLKEMEARRLTEVDHLEENINRLDLDVESARNIDEAIAVLGDREVDPEKHPEKRMRAAYQAFEDEKMPELKKENPTFRISQLKQALWKEWKKSPQNPLNQ
ncbi:unnamed protein product, partial [Mesorhabditis belari]|uniref:HMG box domain-containing protein n=1 Tax=Mesorhabditis belari TaxID=2138241 RepID=A0AAF3FDZ9_9BILA